MKKLLIALGVILGLALLSIILIPILFKDQIFETAQKQIDSSVNADINLDPNGFSLSLIENFPNVTVNIDNFSIVGRAPFKGDTLFASKNLSVELDLFSLFNEAPIQINGILLNQPTINILVLKDGKANYDITVPSEEEEATTDEASSSMEIGIDHWQITNGKIAYFDQSVGVAASFIGVNHQGSGDFTLTVFDMVTSTQVEGFSVAYEDVVYVDHKKLDLDMTLGMDLDAMKFSFKETQAKLNDFALGVEGVFAMPTDDYNMDIQFAAKDNTFKSILSLVPGMYAEGFEGLETSGEFDFSGFLKGIYNDTSMPAFKFDLQVREGYVKSAEVPLPIKNIALAMVAESTTGDMKDGVLTVSDFGLTIDQDRFTAKAKVNNFDSPAWDLKMNGKLNLDIVSKIQPTDDYQLAGMIIANLNSKGNLKAVEAEDYQALQTTGNLQLKNFSYTTEGLPTTKISSADLSFNNKVINLTNASGNLGRSDFKVSGELSNYLAYALQDDGVLMGEMNLNANLLDVNEFMGEEEEESSASEDTTAMELVVIPKNIDFTFQAKANTILYDTYEMKNAVGVLKVKEGILYMDPFSFDAMGGKIKMTGNYNTTDQTEPSFAFNLDLNELTIPETFKSVVTVQKFVPVAEKMTGKFSTNFSFNGLLTQEMMPDFETISGEGLIKVINAAVKDSKVVSGVTSLSKLDKTSTINIGNVNIQAAIEDGKFSVKPFDVKFDKYKATIDGYTSFTGGIGYNLALDVPTGSLGSAANQAISGLIGSNVKAVGDKVTMNFNIGGTYSDPDVKLGKTTSEGESVTSSVKSQVNDKLQAEKDKLKQEADAKVQAAKDSAAAEAARLKKKAEEEAKRKAEEEAKRLKDKAKNKVKDLFGGGGL